MISENAFVCIYLVSQLTKLVSITGTVASMAGSTHRFIFTFFILNLCFKIFVNLGTEQVKLCIQLHT